MRTEVEANAALAAHAETLAAQAAALAAERAKWAAKLGPRRKPAQPRRANKGNAPADILAAFAVAASLAALALAYFDVLI